MATKLTKPITRPVDTHQAVIRLDVHIPHVQDQRGEIRIDRQNVALVYIVATYNEYGELVDRKSRKVKASAWSVGMKNLIKTLYEGVETDAKAAGIIQPGEDEVLS